MIDIPESRGRPPIRIAERDATSTGCVGDAEHDWRVNPKLLWKTNPQKETVVCLICDKLYDRVHRIDRDVAPDFDPFDASTWPKADE